MFKKVTAKFSGQTRIPIPDEFTGHCWLVLNGKVLVEPLDYKREGRTFVLDRMLALQSSDDLLVTDE
jgi:hypothetical protein